MVVVVVVIVFRDVVFVVVDDALLPFLSLRSYDLSSFGAIRMILMTTTQRKLILHDENKAIKSGHRGMEQQGGFYPEQDRD